MDLHLPTLLMIMNNGMQLQIKSGTLNKTTLLRLELYDALLLAQFIMATNKFLHRRSIEGKTMHLHLSGGRR